MGLLLILPLLISGYLVCIKDRALYALLHRYEGQLLYLVVAWQGVVCFSIACFLLLVFSWALQAGWSGNCASAFTNLCPPAFHFDLIGWVGRVLTTMEPTLSGKSTLWSFLTTAGILTFAVPFLLGPLRFWWFRVKFGLRGDIERAEIFAIVKSVDHLPVLKTLASSMSTDEPVMITMTDRKIYVGIVESIGAPTEVNGAAEHFGLWVQTSGYRDKDTLKVTYTYDYPKFDAQTSVPTMFRQENVVSVTPYMEALGSNVVVRKISAASSEAVRDLSENKVRFGVLVGWLKRSK